MTAHDTLRCPFTLGQAVISYRTLAYGTVKASRWNPRDHDWEIKVLAVHTPIRDWEAFAIQDRAWVTAVEAIRAVPRPSWRVLRIDALGLPRVYQIVFGTTRRTDTVLYRDSLREVVIAGALWLQERTYPYQP